MERSWNSDLADEPYAARIASAVLASFMQQPPDTKTILRLLTTLCAGKPKAVLKEMVHPELGVAASNEIFSIAACNKWLAEHLPKSNAAEHRKFLPEPEPEYVPPEIRAKRVAMLKGVAQQIRETVRTNCVGRPSQLEWAKPREEWSEAQKLEAERLSRTQAKNHSALLETDLVKSAQSSNAA